MGGGVMTHFGFPACKKTSAWLEGGGGITHFDFGLHYKLQHDCGRVGVGHVWLTRVGFSLSHKLQHDSEGVGVPTHFDFVLTNFRMTEEGWLTLVFHCVINLSIIWGGEGGGPFNLVFQFAKKVRMTVKMCRDGERWAVQIDFGIPLH